MEWILKGSTHKLMRNGRIIGYILWHNADEEYVWTITIIQALPDLKNSGRTNNLDKAKENAEATLMEWLDRFAFELEGV